jgi:tRNA 2-thiocytidine biosynthesis protein TtcA
MLPPLIKLFFTMNEFSLPKHPWVQCGKEIETLCRKALYDFQMLENQDSIAIALSGGKDSLTLLFMLAQIAGRGFPQAKLHAIHVFGDFSCGAEVSQNYLSAICGGLNIDLTVVQPPPGQEKKLDCYPCSRRRRKLIFEEAKRLGCKKIAFGHHRDDNIQTLLLNLCQKGEFAPMLPKIKMYRYGITIIRPLIYVCQKDIMQFAAHYEFLRARCNCPMGGQSQRKKTDDLLVQMEKIFPHVRSNLALAGLLYGSDKAAKEPKDF